MRRHEIKDDQWARIEHLLPGKAGDPGVTAKDNRLFIRRAGGSEVSFDP
jgi:transposase